MTFSLLLVEAFVLAVVERGWPELATVPLGVMGGTSFAGGVLALLAARTLRP